jgi:hypothetical protein
MSMSEVTFFSESDMMRLKDGTKIISSEYPVWYNEQIIEEIREDLRRDEFNLESGLIPKEQLTGVRDRIRKHREKLEDIESSRPKLSADMEGKVDKARKILAKNIQDRLFTRSQMQKGLADTHMEVRRSTTPDIPVDETIADLAKGCNVQVYNGKITREGAAKIWKITSKYFGEISNVEALRRD